MTIFNFLLVGIATDRPEGRPPGWQWSLEGASNPLWRLLLDRSGGGLPRHECGLF
jgi:hypothetical protein